MEGRGQKAKGRNDRSLFLVLLALLSAFCLLTSCTGSKPEVTPPPAPVPATPAPEPTPAPVVEPPKLPTLDEVRALRTSQRLDLYESGLKSLTQSPDAITQRRALALLALFYVDQKRTAEALPALAQAADADPLAAPWLRLRTSSIDADAANWPDAIFNANRIIHDTPASSAATIARLRLPA